jgi:hypothetical protein
MICYIIMSIKPLTQTNVICPHCTKEGQMPAMKRWHFENCKNMGITHH